MLPPLATTTTASQKVLMAVAAKPTTPNPVGMLALPTHKFRSGILALISTSSGEQLTTIPKAAKERVDAPIFAGRSAFTLTTGSSLWERAEAPLYLDGNLRSNHWQVKRNQWLNRE
jgi:hypothetical protein